MKKWQKAGWHQYGAIWAAELQQRSKHTDQLAQLQQQLELLDHNPTCSEAVCAAVHDPELHITNVSFEQQSSLAQQLLIVAKASFLPALGAEAAGLLCLYLLHCPRFPH